MELPIKEKTPILPKLKVYQLTSFMSRVKTRTSSIFSFSFYSSKFQLKLKLQVENRLNKQRA